MATNIEPNIPAPGRTRMASFSAAVADLEVGDHVAKLHRIDTTLTFNQIKADLDNMRATLRNNTTPAVARARAKTGGSYTIEVGDMMLNSVSWFLVAVVTRTK